MDRESLKTALENAKTALHQEFPGHAASDRLAQFDAHLSTALMVIDHLFDESTRMEGYK